MLLISDIFFANIKNLDKNAPSRFLNWTNGAKSRKTSHL